MSKTILVLIVDPNMPFCYGLAHVLTQRLKLSGGRVKISTRPRDIIRANVLFAAYNLPQEQLRKLLMSGLKRKDLLIFIIDEYNPNAIRFYPKSVSGIIYRHQKVEEVIALVDSKLKCIKVPLNHSEEVKLTKREAEVMLLFYQGLCPRDISKKLGINIKTVSVHKRNVMNKIGISKTSELCQWLFYGSF
ncbi:MULTISPECIES: LuxR C-terminal-related transcriptional regulator [Klebsiella pneumoniae complex]|uniref:LuxR C-terminal-related transcriptional regulator n=1 Tax=Klebsiella pneumoniae complex TaxID=3390273 RepID=UPI002380BC9E|nr:MULTISPECIES: LuxR C-terminal-related transcriptional regulator [Klebsiella]MDE4730361.1 LuxR C-terminal-related transcriptional regulator [Klebsiella pneumoniae]MDE4740305.1 LuxR C-terminal-related transcriptional regulator [Klebsiella pneumoniae]MDE4750030.1 LuxR C-terminal-related transcriptional regulator [Klebsiella pneumoniae]MDE4766071.1 LuxR C-terminal-related transcriptional regulator [Klebsiella pneumoniae]MDE4782032.1 LuxR C-terminal-related transcriptional regulator [Klebsiella 